MRTYDGHPWNDWRGTPGHAAHADSEKLVCKDCHVRGFQPATVDVACGREGCHVTEAAHPHGARSGGVGQGNTGCGACHAFEPGKAAPKCLDCHAEEQNKAGIVLPPIADGHAKSDCQKCHRSHGEHRTVAFECTSCHKERAPIHNAHPGGKGCRDCHAGHQKASTARDSCVGCHKPPSIPGAAPVPCLKCHEPHAKARPTATGARCTRGKLED